MYQIIRYRYDDTNTIDNNFAIVCTKIFENKTEANTYLKQIYKGLSNPYWYNRNNVIVQKRQDGFNYVWAVVEHNIPEVLEEEFEEEFD